jgi:hypothetical protein
MTAVGDPVPETDAAPPRLVRPYAITGGRTRAAGPDLPFETLVSTTPEGEAAASSLAWEQRAIVRMCNRPLAVAEVAAHLEVPLCVARVLVGDLTDAGLIEVNRPEDPGDRPDLLLLERVLDGLREL